MGGWGYTSLIQPRSVESGSRPERMWVVETVPLQRIDIQPQITAYGTVSAGRRAELRSAVTGEVTFSELADGKFVEENTLLLVLDDFPYRSAVADRRNELDQVNRRLQQGEQELRLLRERQTQAQAEVELANAQWQRRESLRSRQAIDLNTIDEARRVLLGAQRTVLEIQQTYLRRETEQQDLKSEQARLERALALAERDLAHTRITAPFAGWLQAPPIALGQRVTPNEVIAQLIDPNRLEVRLEVPEASFARIQDDLLQRSARVYWQLGDREIQFTGSIARLSASLDDRQGGIPLWVALDALPTDAHLRPGTLVRVELADRWFREIFAVPPTALNDRNELFAVEGGRLVRHTATVLHRQADRWLIDLALPDGVEVVGRQFRGIGPGLAVRLAGQKS